MQGAITDRKPTRPVWAPSTLPAVYSCEHEGAKAGWWWMEESVLCSLRPPSETPDYTNRVHIYATNYRVLHVRLEMISEYLPILTCGFCLLANHRAQLPGDPADRHQQAWSQSHWPQVKGSLIIITPGIRIGYVLAAALVNLLSRCSSFDDLCVCRTSWPLTPSPRSPTGAAGTPISTSPSATWSEEANCCVRPHWWVPAMKT